MGETPGWAHPSVPSGYASPGSLSSLETEASSAGVKPSIVPLRPLAVGEILDGGFAVARQHARLVFGVSLVLATVVALANVGLGLALRSVGDVITATGIGPTTFRGVGALILARAVSAVFAAILTGIVAGLLAKELLGQPIDHRETLRATARRYKALIAAGILAGGLPYAPFAFLLIGVVGWVPAVVLGVYLWSQLALALPAMVLERLGPIAAIKRSWSLVKGAFWRIWGIRALAYLAASIAGSVLALGFTSRAAWERQHDEVVSLVATVPAVIGEALAWMVVQPVLAGTIVLLYIDRRMRAEGLDIQLDRATRATAASVTGGS